jgi:signal transduction histidine kinase
MKLIIEELRQKTIQLERAQNDLIRKEKLTVLGQLAGRVAHDLRNPLGVISNAVYYLKAVQGDSNKKVSEYLEIISSEVNKSVQIINELLDFARTKQPQKKNISIKELIDHSISGITIPDNISIKKEMQCQQTNMLGDPVQIGQIFINIILNAVQAMPSGGILEIECSAIENKLAISFRDSGVGIAPENMDKLFHPLYTTKPKGIGLGLTIIKSLAEANGGSIEVKSIEGQGTAFILTFLV